MATYPPDKDISSDTEPLQRPRSASESEVIKSAEAVRRAIGQELHDDIQQQLMGLSLIAQHLVDVLQAAEQVSFTDSAPNLADISQLATRLCRGIAEANRRVRLLSRGLVLHEIDPQQLPAALAELASYTNELGTGRCCFQWSERAVQVADNVVATHLYRIAQEAVTNALKHARANQIELRLYERQRAVVLEILDNGVGIETENSTGAGQGLKIIAYRAALIGATLRIDSRETGGTVVSCTLLPGNSPASAL
jgi:signal transduction histidine kinase